MKIPDAVVNFLRKQHVVFIATVDARGTVHCVPKGICHIDQQKGIIAIMDLYAGQTRKNIRRRHAVTIAFADEHLFAGFQLKGTAKWFSIDARDFSEHIREWHRQISKRVTKRMIENLQREHKTHHHEAEFPGPCGIIEMRISKIMNLAPKMK